MSKVDSIWGKLLRPLLNERGEIGDAQKQPGSGPESKSGAQTWEDPGQGSPSPEGAQVAVPTVGQEAGPSAETLKPEIPAVDQEGAGTQVVKEGAGAQVGEGEEIPAAFHTHPAWQRIIKERDAVRADMETHRQMAEFYQAQLNDRLTVGEREAQVGKLPEPAKPGTPAEGAIDLLKIQLPAGVKGPNEWQDQNEMVPWLQHVTGVMTAPIVEKNLQESYEKNILPTFKRMNEVVGAIEEAFVKQLHPDFDDVTKDALSDLFVMDPSGKVLSVKNPALLNYIRQSPMPKKALYDYALRKKAPQIIKDTKTKTTKDLLAAIDAKPKVTQVKPGIGGAAPATLDWDTPATVADQILEKKGLIN